MQHARRFILLSLLVPAAFPAVAADPQIGNILVCKERMISEYKRNGALVQTFPIPEGAAGDCCGYARDLVIRPDHRMYVHNGTTQAVLSVGKAFGTWSHLTFPYLNTGNNLTYGGVAANQQYAFMTDSTLGADDKGIVRFNLVTGSSQRFANDTAPIDLTLGEDGLLYSLDGRTLFVYHPSTMQLLRTVEIGRTATYDEQRGVAVNASGGIFIVNLDGEIRKLSPAGQLIHSVNLRSQDGGQLSDIDITGDGKLVVCSTQSYRVFLVDQNLSNITSFPTGNTGGSIFVAPVGARNPSLSSGQTLYVNGSGGYQVVTYNYTTAQVVTTPYSSAPNWTSYISPLDQWTGIYFYDYQTARFTSGKYATREFL